jgi:hypothetical protein
MLFKSAKFAEPDNRNWPDFLFLSIAFLIAVKISGHFCASSIVRGSSELTK